MNEIKSYYLVSEETLPPVVRKVIDARKFLAQGTAKTVLEAVRMAGISRSVFYKYQDAYKPVFTNGQHQTLTLGMTLKDVPGVLVAVLQEVARQSFNLLTINQTIPLEGSANLTLTIESSEKSDDQPEQLLAALRRIPEIARVAILAQGVR